MIMMIRPDLYLRALQNADARARRRAASILGLMGPAAKDAVPALAAALEDDDSTVRRCAARALGRIGATTHDIGPALIGAF